MHIFCLFWCRIVIFL